MYICASKSHCLPFASLIVIHFAENLKYVSLICLVVQNAALILTMRYVRTRPGEKFFTTSAVVVCESLKMTTCLLIILLELKGTSTPLCYIGVTVKCR